MNDSDNLNIQSEDSQNNLQEEIELSHTDKLVGVFTEPAKTFESISKFQIKTIDWLLPFSVLLIAVILSTFVAMSNPQVKADAIEKRLEDIRKDLDKQVAEGKLSKEEANQRLEMIESQVEKMSGTIGMVIQSVSILIFGFIIFFIVCGAYFLVIKFGLKDQGTYKHVLAASGLTAYIGIIQVALATILTLVFNRVVQDVSAASLLNYDKSTIAGFLLAKVDVISIWSYVVLSIGLAKLFKSENLKKYLITIFGIWIGWGLIMFFLAKNIPFLKNFGG